MDFIRIVPTLTKEERKVRKKREDEIISTTPIHEMTNGQIAQWESEGLNISKIVMGAGERKGTHNKAFAELRRRHASEYRSLVESYSSEE